MNTQKTGNIYKFQTNIGEAINGFLKEKFVQSPNTATSYKGDITSFLDKVFDSTIETVTQEQMESLDYKKLSEYRNNMFGTLSNSTVNRHLSSIKSLVKHLKATDAIKSNVSYLNLVKSVKVTDEEQYPHAPKEVVERYMDATSLELHKNEEKRLLIMLGADTGLRLQELLDLKLDHISQLPNGNYIIRGYGKGGKPFQDEISESVYKQIIQVADGKKKVFSLSRKNVWDMMSRLTRILGYEDKGYVFHSFKKSAVSFTHKRTGSIAQAMRKGRHSKPETVLRYLEEDNTGLTGMFSSESEVEEDYYLKVSHEELLKGIEKMDKASILLLNMKLSELKKYVKDG